MKRPWTSACLALCTLAAAPLAQEEADALTLHVSPGSLELKVGESARIEAIVLDAQGKNADVPLVYFTGRRGPVGVDSEGTVTALAPGEAEVRVRAALAGHKNLRADVPVKVAYGDVVGIEFADLPGTLFTGTTNAVHLRVVDEIGTVRDDLTPALVSSDEDVVSVDAFGRLVARAPGRCTITASVGGVTGRGELTVVAHPARSLHLEANATHVRTGDVVPFRAVALDADGRPLDGVPIAFAVTVEPDDDLGPGASGQIEEDGRFVAEQPGLYTIHATTGGLAASRSLRVDARDVGREIRLVGRGTVVDEHTSDLWVWEGVDGRDYAVTGTWGSNGDSHFWDVTDPANIVHVGSVTVDARTVNDVKVSPDGTLCVISREGASDRKNGIVLIDVRDPSQPEIVSTFTEELTGGVHNLFIWNDHVLALSAGRRYDIINIEDREKPYRVSSFELDTPGHSIHDVWVADGIAYSSNWGDGVYMVDVGNGRAGGSLENPVVIGHYAYPSGWNHAAFPYHDPVTGKFFVIAGDEAFPYGLNIEDSPTYPRGWLHFIDFSDPTAPVEVARYQVPEAGTHNLWVEGELLYVAYYNGGLRVVDLSGDLLGDLYRQGREVGFFLPTDPEGYVANAPMVWGPQPHKGRIFFSDWNSGLWAVELVQTEAD